MTNGTLFGLVEIVLVALAGILLFSFVALGCHFRKKRNSKNNFPQDEVSNNDELSQEEEGNGLFSLSSWISSVQQSDDDAGGSLDEVSAPTTKEEAKEGDGWYPSWVSSFLEEHNLQ